MLNRERNIGSTWWYICFTFKETHRSLKKRKTSYGVYVYYNMFIRVGH